MSQVGEVGSGRCGCVSSECVAFAKSTNRCLLSVTVKFDVALQFYQIVPT